MGSSARLVRTSGGPGTVLRYAEPPLITPMTERVGGLDRGRSHHPHETQPHLTPESECVWRRPPRKTAGRPRRDDRSPRPGVRPAKLVAKVGSHEPDRRYRDTTPSLPLGEGGVARSIVS